MPLTGPMRGGPVRGNREQYRWAVPPEGGRARSVAGGCLQRVGPVGALPGEVRLLAAEVAVGRGLRVDGAKQVQVPDDRGGPQVEHLEYRVLDALDRHLP